MLYRALLLGLKCPIISVHAPVVFVEKLNTDESALSQFLLDTSDCQFGCSDSAYSVSCSVSCARTTPFLLVRNSSWCVWRRCTDFSTAFPSTFRIEFVVLIVLLLTGWRLSRGLNAFLLCLGAAYGSRFVSTTTGIPGFLMWRLFSSISCALLQWYVDSFWHTITL